MSEHFGNGCTKCRINLRAVNMLAGHLSELVDGEFGEAADALVAATGVAEAFFPGVKDGELAATGCDEAAQLLGWIKAVQSDEPFNGEPEAITLMTEWTAIYWDHIAEIAAGKWAKGVKP